MMTTPSEDGGRNNVKMSTRVFRFTTTGLVSLFCSYIYIHVVVLGHATSSTAKIMYGDAF